jgi:hypothetical protein
MIIDKNDQMFTEKKKRNSFDLSQSFDVNNPENSLDIDQLFEEDKTVQDDFH